MLKQGSSDPTSPRREASLFDLPGSSEPGLFFWAFDRMLVRSESPGGGKIAKVLRENYRAG